MDLLQTLLAFLTPIGLALFALIITREGQKDRAAENLRRDARDEADRQQRVKDNQQFMLLFATITGKQDVGTAQVVKSGVDSEGRLSAQVTTAESNIKGRVTASGDANIAAIEKSYELLNASFKILLARPADPMAAARFDKAIEGLTAQMEQVKDDLEGVKTDTAANTDARVTSEMAAVEVPAEVVITDVSAMGAGATTEGGEAMEDVA